MGKGEGKGLSIPCGCLTVESRKALRKATCVSPVPPSSMGEWLACPPFAPLVSQLPFLTSPAVKALALISSSSPADSSVMGLEVDNLKMV